MLAWQRSLQVRPHGGCAQLLFWGGSLLLLSCPGGLGFRGLGIWGSGVGRYGFGRVWFGYGQGSEKPWSGELGRRTAEAQAHQINPGALSVSAALLPCYPTIMLQEPAVSTAACSSVGSCRGQCCSGPLQHCCCQAAATMVLLQQVEWDVELSSVGTAIFSACQLLGQYWLQFTLGPCSSEDHV